jgi:hypothetical protein
MASSTYLEFLGTVWDSLPEEDKGRLAELWMAYEQCASSVYQKFFEDKLNVAIADILPYSTERWLPYVFDDTTAVSRPATWLSTQDLSEGVDLSKKYVLRLSLDGKDPVEFSVQGEVPEKTKIHEIIAKINFVVGYPLASTVKNGAVVRLTSRTAGLASSIRILETARPEENASEYILGVAAQELPRAVPDFPHVYAVPYKSVSSIPTLQDAIREDSVQDVLTEGLDYRVESAGILSFKQRPLANMWARRTLLDQENPWFNFGFLMDVYQKNSPRYVDILQGLWYAYWTGPKPVNLKRSLYLLFGLPAAKEDCTVVSVGRSEIVTLSPQGVQRTYAVPSGLSPTVSVGQLLSKYETMVTGIEILDKVSSPGFISEYIGRSGLDRFLTEGASRGVGDTDETKALRMLEEYCFLPQIEVDAFISPEIDIGAVKAFLDNIRPLNKTYLFQAVTGTFRDQLGVTDGYGYLWDVDLSGTLDANDTTYSSAEELLAHEQSANPSFAVDPNGVVFQEDAMLEVRSFNALIDAFNA